jgi:hypothetical protein
LNAHNDTKHSTTKFAQNDIKTEDIKAVSKNIKARVRSKNYGNVNDGDTVRLYSQDLHKVQSNNHNGLYIVDGSLRSRKDLHLVKGQVTAIKQRKTAKQVKVDKIGKAAFNPVVKDLKGTVQQLSK